MPMPDFASKTPAEFWEGIYVNALSQTSGRPSQILEHFGESRAPGKALDLGCAKGDDIVWLARRGWHVLGVDISSAALRLAARNAERNRVLDQAVFERHDLSESFPNGEFDLVSAMFLQSPYDFQRSMVLRTAAAAVRPSGLLLIATHQTHAPWSWSDPNEPEITARKRLDDIGLDLSQWHQIFVGPFRRTATGPDGQYAEVTDAVLALERLGPE